MENSGEMLLSAIIPVYNTEPLADPGTYSGKRRVNRQFPFHMQEVSEERLNLKLIFKY